ncbi:UNVERIFIED_CONTAM: hypothetical protein Slati_0734600 [Sesamum latifolium]|uniref:Uncharacterized protein n=1 Tax=Sesamum latifolium TaxID=2727402 RepID=A0AAW2Y5L0_9LAMI
MLDYRSDTSSQSKILDNPSLHDVEADIECALSSRHLIINVTWRIPPSKSVELSFQERRA